MTQRVGRFRLGPIDVEFGPGVTCLVGANGAGKSTLLRLLAGVERADAGDLSWPSTARRVGYLPQDPGLPGRATCEQFLSYVAWLQRVPDPSSAIDRSLASTGLTDRRRSAIRTLSGGMQRRLGIAQAILHDPSVLLLDEPTVGLDPSQRLALRRTIGDLAPDRVVVLSTHLVEDVRGLADRIVILGSGRVRFDGGIADLEAAAVSTAPGDTLLERGLATMLDGAE